MYRKELLKRLHLDFISDSPDIDESPGQGETVTELTRRLALEKARVIAKKHKSGLIIGSDQALECDNSILGKPMEHESACNQLMNMSGKTVTFHTSICLYQAGTDDYELDVVFNRVTFRKLENDEIEDYLKIDQPYHCAGSFKSEAFGITLIEKIEGDDPNALIGLPLIRLCGMLRRQNIKLP